MYKIYYVEGCEGFTYKFKFDTKLQDTDYVNADAQTKKIIFATG
jgi:hypothetical protein